MQVAISPYHPPTAVSPYTTTRTESLIYKLPWNATKGLYSSLLPPQLYSRPKKAPEKVDFNCLIGFQYGQI